MCEHCVINNEPKRVLFVEITLILPRSACNAKVSTGLLYKEEADIVSGTYYSICKLVYKFIRLLNVTVLPSPAPAIQSVGHRE